MSKSVIIIGAGKGLSAALAEKFGKNGYIIGLISRTDEQLKAISAALTAQGINVFYKTGDAGDEGSLTTAINELKQQLGVVSVLIYNAAAIKMKDILNESSGTLSDDIKVNAGGALDAVKILLNDLRQQSGAVLLTGGGLANYPNAALGSISIGKAAIRNLALQLHERLRDENIFVGTLTINNLIDPSSATHTPRQVADKFYDQFVAREDAELEY